jgi:hypothetical protein
MAAALSADDEESQNRQHTDSDEERRMVGLAHLVVFGKDALLAAAIVFQLGNFGRDTFQLDIALRQSA